MKNDSEFKKMDRIQLFRYGIFMNIYMINVS